jgi:hypothetical protein
MIGLKKKLMVGFVDAIRPSDDASITFKCHYFKLAPLLGSPLEQNRDHSVTQTDRKRQYTKIEATMMLKSH